MTELKKEFETWLAKYEDFYNPEVGTDDLWQWIEQKIDEACRKQREICADKATLGLNFDYSSSYVERESILNAPSPELKEGNNDNKTI